MALVHMGMKTISSLTDTNPSATAADVFWDNARDDVFSKHRWPFANTKGLLSLLDDTDIEWLYLYAYPSNAARVFYVYNEETFTTKEDEEFEVLYLPASNKRVIATNTELAYGEYTYKVLDTTLWSSDFSLAFSYKLAAMMAPTLSSSDKGKELSAVYQNLIADAQRLSYQEKIKKPTQTSSTQAAR